MRPHDFLLTIDFAYGRQRLELPAAASLVTTAASPSAVVVLLGRLQYRQDLRDRIGVTRVMPDAELALHAYRQGSVDALSKLEGEFALAIWDADARRLLLQRDPFGGWPLFWTVVDQQMCVGSSLRQVAWRRADRQPNWDFHADYFMCPFTIAEPLGEATAVKDVSRVPAGMVVESLPNGRVIRHPTWDWHNCAEDRTSLTLAEAGEAFRDLLRQAVHERIQDGPVAAHLSGGMDSSAVVCLASSDPALAAPLQTLTLTYERPSLAGERTYAELVATPDRALQAHWLKADAILDYDWFAATLPTHDEPYGGLVSIATERFLADSAKATGARTILTGLGSDEILAFLPYHLADLIRGGRLWRAWNEAKVWARTRNQGAWSVLRRFGLEPIWSRLMRDGVNACWNGGFGRWPSLGTTSIPPWMDRGFAKQYDLARRGQEYARRMLRQPTTAAAVAWTGVRQSVGDWAQVNLAAPHGMRISHPFRDPRLVRFGWGLDPSVRADDGSPKPVLQQAMKGIVPAPILTRRSKRGFDHVYGCGLSRELPKLIEFVTAAARHCDILDGAELVRDLQLAAVGVGDCTACDRLDKALGWLAWHDIQSKPLYCRSATEDHRHAG